LRRRVWIDHVHLPGAQGALVEIGGVVGAGHHDPLHPLFERELIYDVRHVDVAALGQVAVVEAVAGGAQVGQMHHGVDTRKHVAILVHAAQVRDISHLEPLNRSSETVDVAIVHQATDEALPEERQDVAGDVPGRASDQDGRHDSPLDWTRSHGDAGSRSRGMLASARCTRQRRLVTVATINVRSVR